MLFKLVPIAALLMISSASYGQSLTFADSRTVIGSPSASSSLDGHAVDTSQTYLRTLVPSPRGPIEEYIRLSDYDATVDARLSALSGTVDQRIGGAVAAIERRVDEGLAVAASFNIMQPNAGDRFALSLGTAGISGAVAGSVSGSMRIGPRAMAFVGYARSENREMFKGGVGISIH